MTSRERVFVIHQNPPPVQACVLPRSINLKLSAEETDGLRCIMICRLALSLKHGTNYVDRDWQTSRHRSGFSISVKEFLSTLEPRMLARRLVIVVQRFFRIPRKNCGKTEDEICRCCRRRCRTLAFCEN